MGIFTRRRTSVEIKLTLDKSYIRFNLLKNGELVHLPIELTATDIKSVDNLETLLLMEDLFFNQRLIELEDKSYALNYEDLYDIEPGERALLNIPSSITPLTFKLDNKGIVGHPNFELDLSYRTEQFPKLNLIGNRYQNIIKVSNSEILLIPENDMKLINAVEEASSLEGEELLRQFSKIKHLAQFSDVEINEYLSRENYEFVEDVEPDVVRSEHGITIKPSYAHESLDEEVLNDENLISRGYVKHDNKRVFVENKAKATAAKLGELEPIQGADIPRFVENPESFIPEDMEIPLENFSERVKNLGIKVYKAQPYVHANEKERGWFDLDIGYKLKDELGEEVGQESLGFFDTDEDEDFKQLDDNTFVAIPNETQQFEEYASKLTGDPSSGIHSNYVIEIFENIQSVEFNAPIQEYRQQLVDSNALTKTPPTMFKAELRPFQEEGFVWMKQIQTLGFGGLLADDMGLGKTIQVIAFLTHLKESEKLTPTLLVLPKSLIDNWRNEILKFAPDLSKHHYVHMGAGRLKEPDIISQYDLVFTTYDTLVRDQIVLGQVDWQFIVSDEAQKIKNPSTSTSRVIKALKNNGRIALTGTPVENGLTELWSIVDFVQPGLLGSLKQFKEKYEAVLKEGKNYEEVQQNLENELKLVYKRRTKKGELEKQLPKKIEHHGEHLVQMGKEQASLYRFILEQVHNKQLEPLYGLQELKKISSHPGLVNREYSQLKVKQVPKLSATVDILKEVKSNGEKALIFTEYREMQSILKRTIAEEFKVNPMVINGSTDSRQDLIDRFNEMEGFDVLILSPKAAGVGLTITSANHVIHYTRWWNPAIENQATDRAYRIGQEKDVHVYYPMISTEAGNSFEEIVDNLLKEKKELAENVIVPSKGLDIDKELRERVLL
ncbi:DEAD/DEAH box helicase [Piscibacillus halophilus]|uniref:DEAD/DEAH box helicase n=1 Tax=Piscibacillus halophilus TaxID=571933 RepID=UPI00158BBD9C|nr:DEAD/DEAH box helicase [Piscibacillus halophilus]